jgi:hypothetical protein
MKLLEWIGALLLAFGLVGVVYYVGFYEIGVAVDGSGLSDRPGAVVNLGRMHERQLGVGLSVAAVVVGGVLLGAGHVGVTRAEKPRCPYCQGVIEELALVCSHCRKDQPRGGLRTLNTASKPVSDQVEEWYRSNGGGA